MRRTAYIRGTKMRVEKVATDKPPMTALPMGAFCPVEVAMGIMPIIIAQAVIITGLKRKKPALRAACTGSLTLCSSSLAKLMSRMELAEATPTVIMVPIRAGMVKVV